MIRIVETIARKGDWVRISNTVLEPHQRAEHLPEDTKKCPLTMWVKGFLLDEEAKINDTVTIRTYICRELQGTLVAINPSYQHTYGAYVPELSYIGHQLRDILGGDHHE